MKTLQYILSLKWLHLSRLNDDIAEDSYLSSASNIYDLEFRQKKLQRSRN